jgi:hypothetical protein
VGELRRVLLGGLVLGAALLPGAQEMPPAQGPVAPAADSASGADAGDSPEAAAPEGGEEEAAEARPPLFMEAYAEGAYSRHEEDNTSGFSDLKIGKRFDLRFPVDLYAKARMHRDARDFFWNNHLDAGFGARVNLLKGAALTLYAEAMAGYYYRTSATVGDLSGIQTRLDRNRAALDGVQARFQGMQLEIFRRAALEDTVFTRKQLDSLDRLVTAQGFTLAGLDAHLDSLETTRDSLRQAGDSLALIPAGPIAEYRAGFMFWYGTPQEEYSGRGRIGFPLRFWCDVYAEGLLGSLKRTVRTRSGGETYRDSTARFNNLILYMNPDAGVLLMDGAGGSVVAYATLYAWFDTHADWWNNRAMAGPGLRHKPFRKLDLVLAFEYLWGGYYGREREDDPNPYARAFTDVRLLANFWYGLGF